MRRVASWFEPVRQAVKKRACADLEQRLEAAQQALLAARADAERWRSESRQMQQQVRARNEFLASLSHELRAPLNAVLGFADLLLSGVVAPGSAKGQHYLQHIQTSGQRLLQLINDVLDLSKVATGQTQFHPEPVDLRQLIAEVLNVLHTRVVHKRLDVTVDVEADLDRIVVDPARLKQVLAIYLSNAVQFTDEHGRIDVRAWAQEGDRFCVEGPDTGVGSPAADPGRMFAAPGQEGSAEAVPPRSSGLSLALAWRLVEAQGGEVGLRSTPGTGSSFFLVLSRRGSPRQDHQPARDAHPSPGNDAAEGEQSPQPPPDPVRPRG